MKVLSHLSHPSVGRAIGVLCAAAALASAHTAPAGIDVWTSHGPGTASISSLAVDPTTPGTLYVSTGGVYKTQHASGVPSCVGDCSGTFAVPINDLITLVNIDLGKAELSACPHGVPSGAQVDIALLIRAVSNALTGCASGQ